MNDVAALNARGDAGPCQWNGLLAAKGRLQALFLLLKVAADTWWLIAPDVSASSLKTLLRPFVLRSKLEMVERDDLAAFGSWNAGAETTSWDALSCSILAEQAARFTFPAECGARELRIQRSSHCEPGLEADARWRLDDLRCGLPRLSAARVDSWTPHMLGLERLHAFSLKKGCYPGQEIVARTHYLGRSKRFLQRFDADQAIEIDAMVINSMGEEIGNTICNASSAGRHTALVVTALQSLDGARLRQSELSMRPLAFAGT
ncbi:MAG: CAF17-like 4Fe-4S cluster assembly/insertion protein YgfZ [Pseudomarimonas sp.]